MSRAALTRHRFELVLPLIVAGLLATGCRQLGLHLGAEQKDRPRAVTLADLYGANAVDFSGRTVHGLRWDDSEHYLERRDGVLQRVHYQTNEAEPAYDYAALEEALKKHEDFEEGAARNLARHPTILNDERTFAVIEHKERLYFYRFSDGKLRRLTAEPGKYRELTLSPDGGHVGFIRDNDVWTISTETGELRRLTEGGSEDLLNGILDWVYQEEIYGRFKWRAYWWSKDGQSIAYLQLDEREVPTYPLANYLPRHPELKTIKWPKAGDPNGKVRLGIVPAAGGETVWADLKAYEGKEILIVSVDWAPDHRPVFAVTDRESTWLELNDADCATGECRVLLRETSPAWVNYEEQPRAKWLADGSFIWLSAQDGWRHIYHYARDGRLIRRVTEGAWEARALEGVDEKGGFVYFSSGKDSPVETHAYRVPLRGGLAELLTTPGSTHSVDFDPEFRRYIDNFSNQWKPGKTYIRETGGEVVRVLAENEVATLKQFRISKPEILRIPTDQGYSLNMLLIRPLERRSGKHPVLMTVYGGPYMPAVSNQWSGTEGMLWQYLAAQGYIVCVCDPHSASRESAAAAWRAWQRLGVKELEDLERAVDWLVAKENADPKRVAIFGHSYGGFMASYALTHGSKFTAGIAVAALTDWRNYDTVYTEKLMRTPQNNPEGYKLSSVVEGAPNLHGHLLILHGAIDDNVHIQNAYQLMDALNSARKDYDVMIYPPDDHGVHGYYRDGPLLGLEFLERHFGTPKVERPAMTADRPRPRRPRAMAS